MANTKTKKKRAYQSRAMERFKRRGDGPQDHFVTQIGEETVVSKPIREVGRWVLETHALIRECHAAMPADVAPGAAYVLVACDLLELQWGEAACWERLDVAEAARFAQLLLPYPNVVSLATSALLTFLSFLRGTGRLRDESGGMMAS